MITIASIIIIICVVIINILLSDICDVASNALHVHKPCAAIYW